MKKYLLITILFSCNAWGQDFFNKSTPNEISMMKEISPGRTLAGYPIPTAGFSWKSLAVRKYSSTGPDSSANVELGEVVLADVRDNKLHATLIVRGNLSQSNMSDWTNEPCKREDFLWKRTTGGKFSNQNCAFINHRVNFFKAPTGVYQQILGEFKSVGLDIPPTMLTVEFTRYASSGRYLLYRFEINPEIYGVPRDAESVWGASSWHKSRLQSDPLKVTLVSNLSRWATDVQGKMDDAFDKRIDPFSQVSGLESYLSPKGKVEPAKTESLETKLEKLKTFRDKNLLTQEQYTKQVDDILSGK